MLAERGPLSPLVGEWEGAAGIDTVFSPSMDGGRVNPVYRARQIDPLRARTQRSATLVRARLPDDDVAGGRCDALPRRGLVLDLGRRVRGCGACLRRARGITVIAGGIAQSDTDEFSLCADEEGGDHAIVESPYLAEHARSLSPGPRRACPLAELPGHCGAAARPAK